MRRTTMIGLAIMLGLAATLPQTLTAQNEETQTAESEKEFRGFLPFHFGKLGMSKAQKDKVYAIQDAYEGKIEQIRKQIEELENQRDKEMETLLTPGQKLRLKELREEAATKAEEAEKAQAEKGDDAS